MIGIAGCCARAASGQESAVPESAVPPSAASNSRRSTQVVIAFLPREWDLTQDEDITVSRRMA
jgi:hypothetical protein